LKLNIHNNQRHKIDFILLAAVKFFHIHPYFGCNSSFSICMKKPSEEGQEVKVKT